MSSLLDIGINSLFASKYALTVTNQNIANADNPFYTRRAVDFKEISYSLYGNGVQIADVRRIVDEVANRNLIHSNSDYANASRYYQELKGFESLMDEGTTTTVGLLEHSLTELNGLNLNTPSIAARNSYLYQMNAVARQFNQLSEHISQSNESVKKNVQADVGEVNEIAEKIAKINAQIAASSHPNSPENMPLLDDRDKLLNTLASYINIDVIQGDRGVIDIQVGHGTPLVTGSKTMLMQCAPSTRDPSRLEISLLNGSTPINITPTLSGGEIAGLLVFQQTELKSADQTLNRLAIALAQNINAQNQLGVDLNGRLGGRIFTDINAPDSVNTRVWHPESNLGSGNLSVTIDDPSQLTGHDYQLKFDSPTHYQLIRGSDDAVVSTGDITTEPHTLQADGFTLTVTNAHFAAGDTFTVSPTHNAANRLRVEMTDPRQLALGSPLLTRPSEANRGHGALTLNAITNTKTPAFSTAKELTPPMRIEFLSATQYRLVSLTDESIIADNLTYDPTQENDVFPTAAGIDPGYRVSLTGAMETGDQFFIEYNLTELGDNRNGLLLAECYQKGILEGGSLNWIQGLHALSMDVSVKTNYAKMNAESQSIIKTQAELRRDQASGVSLEEETMNMVRYQQAYQASAQILETVKSMFDVVLNVMRR